MTIMAGKSGLVMWDAAVVGGTEVTLSHIQSWTCTYTHDVAEITSMQESWRTYFTGHQDWSATVECLLPTGAPQIPFGGPVGIADEECQLELYFKWVAGANPKRAVYGNAICTGRSTGLNAEDIATVTYTFQGVSQLLWYTSETAEPGE